MKKKKQSTPRISTASLPDIVFMLLFFFMVVTVLRVESYQLDIVLPEVRDLTKLSYNRNAANFYIGRSNGSQKIQLNDKYMSIDQVENAIRSLAAKYPNKPFENFLEVDQDTKMRLVHKVKIEMRKAEQYKLNYVLVEE